MAAVGGTEEVGELSSLEADLAAYLDAASGDAYQALIWALEDLIRTEQALEAMRGLVSRGYVRSQFSAQREP